MTACPHSIREINGLPDQEKHNIYKKLLPDWLFTEYGIDKKTLRIAVDNQPIVTFRCPAGSRAMELIVKRRSSDFDPMLYLNMADTFNNQLLVLLVIVNDPDATRYNIDFDEHGNPTHFGTTTRNKVAELEAMRAGLSPGQVRKGLRKFRDMVPLFEEFVSSIGHNIFFIEPLAYTNAIMFERYGFNYLHGYQEMVRINAEFQPGGELYRRLTSDNPFRPREAWKSVRGRAWAIHDGILGHPFTGFQMYKHIGRHANINTFPNAKW